MLRSNTLSVLQKTYDDSYLSCSTAVYYESQGDELEAMRHWRGALDQIYEHNATKVSPTYTAQTDTEKALQDALRQLELQCKERLDLLEALRASRQPDPTQTPTSKLSKAPAASSDASSRTMGSIGDGTIPAVSYSELSRPSLPHRPSLPKRPSLANRTSSEEATIDASSSGPPVPVVLTPSTSNNSTTRTHSPSLAPRKSETNGRSASPEKHTMRTTLRSGRSNERSPRPPRKPSKPATEGPSKAATLAWSSRSSRDRLLRVPAADKPVATSPQPSTSRSSLDQPRKSSSSQLQWDSHSRRLLQSREGDTSAATQSAAGRHSDEYPFARPSLISVSAASSALGSTSNQEPVTAEKSTWRQERNRNPRSSNATTAPPAKTTPFEPPSIDSGGADESGDGSEKRRTSAGPTRKPAVVRRTGDPRQANKVGQHQANRSRPRERPRPQQPSSSDSENMTSNSGSPPKRGRAKKEGVKGKAREQSAEPSSAEEDSDEKAWKKKKAAILKNLPTGVEESAAKQILNDIIVQGDEVRWGDIAGLEVAKNALRETVVYPFLRPDLFMGLREPARGMLLFGPPGTGKTMLARAVATESRSTFFSISASSLTSKYLGESEKLVKALFGLARALAPSIIFVDEIDSLLSQRSGSGEHEATRRIKTEFLIQWSDLQRAAAGRETTERDKERGDANRVLVLAATNLPWAIDEAARRRFVRRQYIPLPEPTTRETQLRTLLGEQKHNLAEADIRALVDLTDGFSGSDITSLAKDAAMGPLRSLGEALLHMSMDDIRPIMLIDFEASLGTIRPSVGKAGLKEYEDWAREFGERGG